MNFLPLSFLQKDIWELTGSVRFMHNRANIKLIQYLNKIRNIILIHHQINSTVFFSSSTIICKTVCHSC